MDSRQFFELVEEMRVWQKRYFNKRTRNKLALDTSKDLEKAVDAEIARVRAIIGQKPQAEEPKLF